MTTLDDVRSLCSKLPAVEASEGRFSFGVLVKGKSRGFVWTWAERVHPKKARVINEGVVAVRVPNLTAKEMLLASEPDFCFTEDHYNGYPAVLIRLSDITVDQLEPLLIEAWRTVAPKTLLLEFDAQK